MSSGSAEGQPRTAGAPGCALPRAQPASPGSSTISTPEADGNVWRARSCGPSSSTTTATRGGAGSGATAGPRLRIHNTSPVRTFFAAGPDPHHHRIGLWRPGPAVSSSTRRLSRWPVIEFRLRVTWNDIRKRLKLSIPTVFKVRGSSAMSRRRNSPSRRRTGARPWALVLMLEGMVGVKPARSRS